MINIVNLSAAKIPDQPVHIVYVPSHLYHMLFELFKVRHQLLVIERCALIMSPWLNVCVCVVWQNAMRATVETHEMSLTLPPIKVQVSLGSEDLTIKVQRERGVVVPL